MADGGRCSCAAHSYLCSQPLHAARARPQGPHRLYTSAPRCASAASPSAAATPHHRRPPCPSAPAAAIWGACRAVSPRWMFAASVPAVSCLQAMVPANTSFARHTGICSVFMRHTTRERQVGLTRIVLSPSACMVMSRTGAGHQTNLSRQDLPLLSRISCMLLSCKQELAHTTHTERNPPCPHQPPLHLHWRSERHLEPLC